ncbi:MAG: D-glycero-beta-D-manno-heptose 1-phosphate adenylyltransferase [Alphaproteobacteria bacterium]|nr:D-glycero-beta-D-manno-heptose 1-phosphate adenylyltransferase [Alphaproteobacteria bacterium]
MADNSDLLPHIERLKAARVLCVGDVMLDHYIFGQVERVSPEAPIPVLWIEREMKTLGGAGNVLRNLRALGAAASFISVVGNDEAGREIGRLVEAQDGTEAHVLVQPQRTTTVKTRYVAGSQQLLRADRESAIPLDPYIREDLLRLARELVADHSVVVVSDYAKGVLTEGMALEIIRAARDAGARVIVDPKGGDHIRYRGANLVKPNRRELAHATGMPVATDSEIIAASRALIERCGFNAVLASLGAEGSVLVSADGMTNVQRAEIREVFDVSGAGDTVVAVVAAALAVGVDLSDAARLAGIAAGIVVGKTGTAVAYAGELTAALNGHNSYSADKVVPRSHALDLIARWRRQGLKIGFTNGCFDLLHPGHVALLGQAKGACDRLIVGLNSDASIARLKGPRRPIQNETERAAVLATLAAVDLIVVFQEDTPMELIRDIRPQLLVKGEDYQLDEVVGVDFVKRTGGEVLLAKIDPDYNRTATIARLAS